MPGARFGQLSVVHHDGIAACTKRIQGGGNTCQVGVILKRLGEFQVAEAVATGLLAQAGWIALVRGYQTRRVGDGVLCIHRLLAAAGQRLTAEPGAL
jgi:hypothetical protein